MFSEYGDALSEQEVRPAGISALISKTENLSALVENARSLLYRAAA
jgi:hypothetical protein